ncbi:MAG: hypothetical protein ABIT01_02555 [Thermoanaerobaculia bacterium]
MSLARTEPGPPLEALTHRLAETPGDFLAAPRIGNAGTVDVAAVVSDLLHALGGERLHEVDAAPFVPGDPRRATLQLVAGWLLHDPWFRQAGRFAEPARSLLASGLDRLLGVIAPADFISDPDRREELVRLVLKALGLRPEGESETQAADRLTTLDSVERLRVMRDTRLAQERIRKVQEAMEKKAAEEAAAAYGRE